MIERDFVFQLRLHNALLYKGEMCFVESISLDSNDESEPYINLSASDRVHEYIVPHHQSEGVLLPIELTPEILGKIKNCEKIYDGTYSTKWDIAFRDLRYICITYAKPDNTWSVTHSSTIVMKQPTLHWLQNIIYYNWGQDLEITL